MKKQKLKLIALCLTAAMISSPLASAAPVYAEDVSEEIYEESLSEETVLEDAAEEDETEEDALEEVVLEESKTKSIAAEVRNEKGEISGMYTMENIIVTEQEDGTYLVRMHQASVNRDYLAIVESQDDDGKNAATNHEVDWYIGTDDGYTFVIPVNSLEETLYFSMSKTANVQQGKAWSNVMALTFDTTTMVDTEEAEVTADEMNVDPVASPGTESVVTELTITNNTVMFKVLNAKIVEENKGQSFFSWD